jgi:hypothetical protein
MRLRKVSDDDEDANDEVDDKTFEMYCPVVGFDMDVIRDGDDVMAATNLPTNLPLIPDEELTAAASR